MHFYMSQASEVYSIFGEVYFRINKHAIQKFQTIIPEMTFLPKNSLFFTICYTIIVQKDRAEYPFSYHILFFQPVKKTIILAIRANSFFSLFFSKVVHMATFDSENEYFSCCTSSVPY